MNTAIDPTLSHLLPLPAKDYEVLIVLLEGGRHGYGIVKEIEARTGGQVRLEPANLYRRLRRLMRDGLVEESVARPTEKGDDARRRYYEVTDMGKDVARAEAARMRTLVREAEARELLPGRGASV